MAMRRIVRLEIFPILVGVAILIGAVATRPTTANPVVRTTPLSQRVVDAAIDDGAGRTYVATVDDNSGAGRVEMLDTTTGAPLGAIAVDGEPTAVVDGHEGHVFVASSLNGVAQVTVLNARAGTVARTLTLSGNSYPMAIAVDERTGRLFVASPGYEACFHAAYAAPCSGIDVFDIASGRRLRTFTARMEASAIAVASHANRLVVAGDDGSHAGALGVLDATTGKLLRDTPIGARLGLSSGRTLVVDDVTGRAFVFGDAFPTYTGGNVYVFDVRGGALLRVDQMTSAPTGVDVDARLGRAYVSTLGPVRRVVNAGGASIVPIGDGGVSIIDARDGKVLRTVATGVASLAVAADARDGRVLVASVGNVDSSGSGAIVGAGSVTDLDARSGGGRRTISVGVLPVGVLVDERRRRAVVVAEGGTVRAPDAWGWVPPWLRRALPFLPRSAGRTRDVPASVTVLDLSR